MEIEPYDILVWCLPGAQKARIVLYDEEGNVAARTVGLPELIALQGGVHEAIKRLVLYEG